MATIQSPGLGSGLDINSIVTKLMSVESQPLQKMQIDEQSYQTKLSAVSILRGSLSSFQSSAKAVATLSKFTTMKSSIVDSTLATVSASNTAAPGSYELEVQNLATAQKLYSGVLGSTSSASLGSSSGQIKIEFGTTDSGFTLNPDRAAVTIDLTSSQMTLAGIRDAINAKNAGVSASLVTTGSGVQMILTNTQTGAANSMRITVTDPDGSNTDDAGLSKLAYDPAGSAGNGKNLLQQTAAQNATIKLDTFTISSATNTVSGAVDGLTINLLKADLGTTTTLKVEQDDAAVKQSISTFIGTYNGLMAQLRSLTKVDTANKNNNGPLQGDALARSITTQMRQVVTELFGTDSIKRLTDIGATLQTTGVITLDSTKFDAAFKNNRASVVGLFTSGTSGVDGQGLGGRIDTMITGYLATDGGIAGRTTSLNTNLKTVAARRTQLQQRLVSIEQRYRTQFNAMDQNVSKLQSLSSYLQQQIASLPGFSSNN